MKKIKNKKAQAQSIIIFFGLVVAILIVSIIVLRLTNAIITPFQAQIGNLSAPAGVAVDQVHDKFTQWWDWFVIGLFFINVIFLLVSAFLIDIHPAFVVVYIVAVIFLFVFGNYALSVLDNIWNSFGTSVEEAQTPLQQFLINNFQLILLGIVILSGVVMYAKIKFFSSYGAGSGNY